MTGSDRNGLRFDHASVSGREEESTEGRGHITSLAVLRTHRKLGLATKLMTAARELGFP